MRNESDSPARHRVAVVATGGVPLFELAIAVEVFGIDRRDLTPDWYEFVLVAGDGAGTATSHGLSVPDACGLEALATADTVIVPACADVHDVAPAPLLAALRAAHERGSRVAAICSGAFVLAQAGLLDGRRATTHWMHADELARRHPAVVVDAQVLYVHDDVWTSAGSAAGLDMCLEIVRHDHGAALANELARRIVIPPHRDGGQAQYVRMVGPGARDRGPDVLDWARHNLARATVTRMAAQAGVSTRTLNRRVQAQTGRSPQLWLQRLRLDTAAELLETTDRPLDSIARQVGLGSASNLRARFVRGFGVSPSSYRHTFGSPTPGR
ncbi:MAG TPA: helix-turn-helix domain-containing protein [Jatrophihabitans sp.]